MYTVVKCKGCTKIFEMAFEQSYFICPACGSSFQRSACTSYLECEDRVVARKIAAGLDELLRKRKIPELTPEEAKMLQDEYKGIYQKCLEECRIQKEEEKGETGYNLFE